jgi:nitronate monooxygenase/enoyl-[acyl-carrier protein] reductase II
LGIEHPVIEAALGPWSSPELTAAVSDAGGIGSVGTALASPAQVREHIRAVRELTDRPFIVNHTARPFVEEVFAVMLDERPAVVSYAIGDPGELVVRVHDAGCLFMQQVHTVEQAERAAAAGVDLIVAQGGEAGGFGGTLGALGLVPQVVDAVGPVPVVAAGGIADGRGLAAALTLGAVGINVGTRFLASEEAGIPDEWKRRIVAARSEDTVKVEFAPEVFPPAGPGGYDTRPRVLETPFVEEWNRRRDEIGDHAARVSEEMVAAVREDRGHEYVPFTGETTGLISEVLPAGEIVRRFVAEAEASLSSASSLAAGYAARSRK